MWPFVTICFELQPCSIEPHEFTRVSSLPHVWAPSILSVLHPKLRFLHIASSDATDQRPKRVSSLASVSLDHHSFYILPIVIIDALLRGYNDGNDILNLSLGGPDGWTESSSSVIASRIAGLGTVVVMAAGNFGASGSWYTQSPANGVDVISIASLDK